MFAQHLLNRMISFSAVILVSGFLLSGCSSNFGTDGEISFYEYNFDKQPDSWSALFSNYNVGEEDRFELESGYRSLPAPLDTSRTGFLLSGRNLSDDLNMYLKHQITDLEPEQTYELTFEVSFATDAPSGCAGVGGPPGEGVSVHVDAKSTEPERVVEQQPNRSYYRLNWAEEYDGDGQNWYRATEIGDVANSRNCEEGREYEIKQVSSGPREVTTDTEGRLWLLIGTRSGFEATTALFYTDILVRLTTI